MVGLLERATWIRRSLKAVLSWGGIVRKLKGQRESITKEYLIADPEFWTMRRKEQSEDQVRIDMLPSYKSIYWRVCIYHHTQLSTNSRISTT